MNLTINVKSTDLATSAKNPLTVPSGGIKIGLVINPSTASTFTQAVTNGTAVNIEVTKAGYYPYTMTIDNVYSADKTIDIVLQEITTLTSNVVWRFDDNGWDGSTSGSGSLTFLTFVSTNPHPFVVGDAITITQDPGATNSSYDGPTTVTNVIDAYTIKVNKSFGVSTPAEAGQIVKTNVHPYGNIYPDMFHFVDPCSFKADYYSANSGDISQSSWYVNNELYTTGTKAKIGFAFPGDYQITHVVENTDWLKAFATTLQGNTNVDRTKKPIADLLALDGTTNLTIAEYRPDLSLTFSSGVSPIATKDITCYTRDEVITITPSWTLNRPGAVAANHTIVYTVTDPDGSSVTVLNSSNTAQNTFPLNVSATAASGKFTMSELGTYKIQAKIVDSDCNTEFPIEYCIKTCNFVNVKYKECNTFTIENRSSLKDFNYSIEQHGVTGVVASGTVGAGTSVDITFSNPGLFIMTSNYLVAGSSVTCPDSNTEQYIISNHCEVEKCITNYLTDLLCGGGDPCAPCPEDNELNQILLMSYTYFMKLNKEYALNNFYTGLSAGKLDELTSISGILNKMSLFCNRRNCLDSSFSENTSNGGTVNSWVSKSGDCGCNSTNSANTNVNTSSSGCGCS